MFAGWQAFISNFFIFIIWFIISNFILQNVQAAYTNTQLFACYNYFMEKMANKSTRHQNKKEIHQVSADNGYNQHSSDFYKQVIESISDYAVFTTTTKGIISSWNAGAEKLLGYARAEIIDQPADILFTEEDRKKKEPAKEMKEALRNGRASGNRYHRRKDVTTVM